MPAMPEMTTAQALGQYRLGLIEQGFKGDVAALMAMEAARIIIGDRGLTVAPDEASA